MSVSPVGGQRLHHQGISRRDFQRPAEVVAWLGAMQGQDYAGAKWSVALRMQDCTDDAVEQAIDTHRIVRTWLLRGTLHLVAPADVRWMLALVAPRLIAGNKRRYGELELDEATLSRSSALLLNALQGGGRLTRSDLFAMLEAHGISTQGQRGVYMVQRASLDGLIVQGATRRNYPTFVAFDEAVPPTASLTRDEALAELAKRYFTSHGPATLPDFATWSGLPVTDARAGLTAVQSALVQDTIDGVTYWQSPSAPVAEAASSVHLLSGFDEFLLGYKDRGAVLDPQYAQRLHPGGNGVFKPYIVSGGRVVGTWKRTVKPRAVVVEAQAFTSLNTAERRGFEVGAQRFAHYLGMPLAAST